MIKCRFAVHTMTDGSRHVDLFININETDDLLTFEIAQKHIETLESFFQKIKDPVFIISDAVPDGYNIPLKEKNPHRRIYLDYEGIIEGNRGYLKHMGYAFLEKISKNPGFMSRK